MNYTQFYKEVRQYATNCANRLFRDGGIDEVDIAMDKVVDRILEGEVTLSLAKRIAHDTLINIFRATPVNKNKNLKARLSQIKGRANEVMTLYSRGMRQIDIARKLDVSKQYISEVVKKWTI